MRLTFLFLLSISTSVFAEQDFGDQVGDGCVGKNTFELVKVALPENKDSNRKTIITQDLYDSIGNILKKVAPSPAICPGSFDQSANDSLVNFPSDSKVSPQFQIQPPREGDYMSFTYGAPDGMSRLSIAESNEECPRTKIVTFEIRETLGWKEYECVYSRVVSNDTQNKVTNSRHDEIDRIGDKIDGILKKAKQQ